MSEFKKKAKTEGPRIYRVRDVLELFKNSKVLIRIIKRQFPKEYTAWSIGIIWDYAEGRYNLYKFPAEILNRVVFDVQITNKGSTLEIYI